MPTGYTSHFTKDSAGAVALRRSDPCAICGGAKAIGAYANPICAECRIRLAGDELGRARLALLLAGEGAGSAAKVLAAATRPALVLLARCGACDGSGQVLDRTFWDGDGPAVDCEACGGTGTAVSA